MKSNKFSETKNRVFRPLDFSDSLCFSAWGVDLVVPAFRILFIFFALFLFFEANEEQKRRIMWANTSHVRTFRSTIHFLSSAECFAVDRGSSTITNTAHIIAALDAAVHRGSHSCSHLVEYSLKIKYINCIVCLTSLNKLLGRRCRTSLSFHNFIYHRRPK